MTEAAKKPVNARQDDEIAVLKAQIEALTKLVENKASKPALGVLTNDEAAKQVLAARSKKPKTYRALQAGTDLTQGLIPEGALFTTTQPQGSWMELVGDEAADDDD